MSIKNRLKKLESTKEAEKKGGVIITGSKHITPENWESIASDYMEKAGRIARDFREEMESSD